MKCLLPSLRTCVWVPSTHIQCQSIVTHICDLSARKVENRIFLELIGLPTYLNQPTLGSERDPVSKNKVKSQLKKILLSVSVSHVQHAHEHTLHMYTHTPHYYVV